MLYKRKKSMNKLLNHAFTSARSALIGVVTAFLIIGPNVGNIPGVGTQTAQADFWDCVLFDADGITCGWGERITCLASAVVIQGLIVASGYGGATQLAIQAALRAGGRASLRTAAFLLRSMGTHTIRIGKRSHTIDFTKLADKLLAFEGGVLKFFLQSVLEMAYDICKCLICR